MKRYVQETMEQKGGENLQVVVVYENKQKPADYKYVVFANRRG